MTTKDLNRWIMYYEIQKLSRMGFSKSRIATYLSLDRRTVAKYLWMSEQDYEAHLTSLDERDKILSPYEGFVKQKLQAYPDTSAAQIADWLKEQYADLPEVTSRSVYNFVIHVRQKYGIPIQKAERDYFPVEELPYGQQSQVDFGQYNMRTSEGKRVKVYFFAMVLSRSRMKFVLFSREPFTAISVCDAHEGAFAFLGGIPLTVVYDQDRTMMVDENLGNIILTDAFRKYVRARGFQIHFCRKADPQSKGKIENVIKYVKINFLTNRIFYDLDTLNNQALAWLSRTANYLVHHTTKKSPVAEHAIETGYLQPYHPLQLHQAPEKRDKTYLVRKHNVVHYKGNFYSVPQGTYKGPETWVAVRESGKNIEIHLTTGELIATHERADGKGKTIINTNHKRDTTHSISELKQDVCGYFKNASEASAYLEEIRRCYPRYQRDHLEMLLKTLKNIPPEVAEKTLAFSVKNKLYNALDFEKVASVFSLDYPAEKPQTIIKPLYPKEMEKANQTPEKSNIDDYENIINAKK